MTATEPDTKTRILDAAEELFAEHGFGATSLRAITGRAGANLAAVNYHFGSKEELISEIFRRRISPINEIRLAQLESSEAGHHPHPVPVEEILTAFVQPAVRCLRDPEGSHRHLFQLMGRIHAETPEHLESMFLQLFSDVVQRFRNALHRAVPELDATDLAWRFHFMVATLIHTLATFRNAEIMSGGLCKLDDEDELVGRLVGFLAAGWRAPASTGASTSPKGKRS